MPEKLRVILFLHVTFLLHSDFSIYKWQLIDQTKFALLHTMDILTHTTIIITFFSMVLFVLHTQPLANRSYQHSVCYHSFSYVKRQWYEISFKSAVPIYKSVEREPKTYANCVNTVQYSNFYS